MSSRPLLHISILTAFVSAATLPAQDKSGHTLFNPTPRDQMRELSTDRPDQTESPYTVDAGHWQFEWDFFNYTRDRESGVRTDSFNTLPINVKLGLDHATDIQFIFDGHVRERTKLAGAASTRIEDWGDLTVRVKRNIFGNDTDGSALAVMPWVKIPLNLGDAGNNHLEGGVIVPIAIPLAEGWGLGLMTQADAISDAGNNGHHLEWTNSITVSHDLGQKLGAYLEFFSTHSWESGADWIAQADIGFTYAVNDDMQLDAGCNFGVTSAAPDLQPFIGMTVRY